MASTLCLDASFLLACLLPEELSQRARRLWDRWQAEGAQLVAPRLFVYEVIAGLSRAVQRGRISQEEGGRGFALFLQLLHNIQLLEPAGLLDRAWDIGKRLGKARLYDAFYLALGLLLDCEVWTVDRRLYERALPLFPLMRWVGHVQG